MTFPRARLTVAATLFILWLGYLLYLVLASRATIVLSRPQFIAADVWVLAEVADNDGKPAETVKLLEVFKPAPPANQALIGMEVDVHNLPEAATQGYIGPGKYILPLEPVRKGPVRKGKDDRGSSLLQLVPRNAGYEPAFVNVRLWSLGKNNDNELADRVAALAATTLGVELGKAQAVIKPLRDRHALSVTLARGAPRDRAVEFIKKLHDVDRDAEAGLVGDDIRIYPWTPETKEQIEELLK
jgi:hypothetical protein